MENKVKYKAGFNDLIETQNRTIRFKEIANEMCSVFQKKNADYGNSTSKTYKKYGAVSYLTRMDDKFNRIENLALNDKKPLVGDENLIDTLTDLAVYCMIYRMEIENEIAAKIPNVDFENVK